MSYLTHKERFLYHKLEPLTPSYHHHISRCTCQHHHMRMLFQSPSQARLSLSSQYLLLIEEFIFFLAFPIFLFNHAYEHDSYILKIITSKHMGGMFIPKRFSGSLFTYFISVTSLCLLFADV